MVGRGFSGAPSASGWASRLGLVSESHGRGHQPAHLSVLLPRLRKLQSCLYRLWSCPAASSGNFHAASANVRLHFSVAHPDLLAAFSARSRKSPVVSPSIIRDLGQHSRHLCLRAVCDWRLLDHGLIQFSRRRPHCAENAAAPTREAAAYGAVLRSGAFDNALWLSTRRQSLRNGHGTAAEYRQYPGVAAAIAGISGGNVRSGLRYRSVPRANHSATHL